MIRLRAATANDRTALAALLTEADMDYTDPPEAYIAPHGAEPERR